MLIVLAILAIATGLLAMRVFFLLRRTGTEKPRSNRPWLVALIAMASITIVFAGVQLISLIAK
jgi:H+/Cl- antiporter ClcA